MNDTHDAPPQEHPDTRENEPQDGQPQDGGPQHGASDQSPRAHRDHVRELARFRRTSDGPLAGVAGGLGRHFDIDPVIFRVLFVVLTITGGVGVLLYATAWLVVPREDKPRAAIDVSPQVRTALLVGVGVLAALLILGGGLGVRLQLGAWLVPVAAIGFVWWLVARGRGGSRPTGPEGPGVTTTYAEPPPPPRPRRAGRILFWPTLALIALVEGVLGLVGTTGGVDVNPTVFPAAALAVVGLMLVVGAWTGRPGGLPLLGLLTAVVLALTSLAAFAVNGGVDRSRSVVVTPASVSQLRSAYSMHTGQLEVDLSALTPADLAGRTLALHGSAGRLVVTLPPGVPFSTDAHIRYFGRISAGGRTEAGLSPALQEQAQGGTSALQINADLKAGDIEVNQP